jgi:hypothetical protein
MWQDQEKEEEEGGGRRKEAWITAPGTLVTAHGCIADERTLDGTHCTASGTHT